MASRLILASLFVFCGMACSEKDVPKMSQEWCDAMLDKPNSEWTEEDFRAFAADCLYNDDKHTK